MTNIDDGADATRLIIPALGGLYKRFAPLSYAFMRFSAGAVLFPHGVQKVFTAPFDRYVQTIAAHHLPFPAFLAFCTYFSEFVASACLALGFLTRVMALIIFIQMTVIIFVFQWDNGYFWTKGGIEYALLWWLLCLAIFFRGGGRYSIDHLIGREF